MADVEVQNGKGWADAEEVIAIESKVEVEDDLFLSKDDSDASYVFVSGDADRDSPMGRLDLDSNDNESLHPDRHAPPPDAPCGKLEEEDSTALSQDPQPYTNGVHDTELHFTIDPLVHDASAETVLSNAVEDGTLEVAAEQSVSDSFDTVISLPVHVVDDEGKDEAEPHPYVLVQDSQVSVVEDAQSDANLGDGEEEVAAIDPQTEPEVEPSHDPDMPSPSLEKDVAADEINSPDSGRDNDLCAGLANHLVDCNGDSSELSLSHEVQCLDSSDTKNVERCPIDHDKETPEHLAYETSVVDGNMVEVVNADNDSVPESIKLPDVSREALLSNGLVDLPDPTPGENQLPIVVEALPSDEDAYVSRKENGVNVIVRALEPETIEEVEETTSETATGDSIAKESHLPEHWEVRRKLVHADVVDCGLSIGMTIGTIPLTISSEDVSKFDVAKYDGRFNEDNPEQHISEDESTDAHYGETDPSKEVEAGSIVEVEDVHCKDVHVSDSEILDTSMNSTERTSPDLDFQSGVDQNSTVDSLDKTCEENGTNGIRVDEISTSSLEVEGSSSDTPSGQDASSDVVRRQFYYVIKVPRFYEDQSLRDQITDAEYQVAEKTKSRDSIQAQRQISRGKWREYADIIKVAKAARGSLSAKRREMDSINLLIDKVKVASQVSGIDAQIRNMEHSIQHETLPLKEEKQLIREMKQLKQEREQLSCKMASQVEVQQAFDQMDQAEESLKLLKKEADLLRENFLKAEAPAKVAERKLGDEMKKLEELDALYESANASRQEAYALLQSLKKQFHDKRRLFSQLKGDSDKAKALALNKDHQGLEHNCDSQLERVMELWNNDEEFRKDYLRCNLRSTIWRLGTTDGRSLGPGEAPPVIPAVNEKVTKLSTVTSEPNAEVEKSVPRVDMGKGGEQSLAKVEDKKPMSRKKDTVKPASEVGTTTVSGEIIEQAREEDHKLTKEVDHKLTKEVDHKLIKEEEEMAKMAEVLRKEEEAAELKEQRKMEEKAKAIEAMERKKRNAERAQARAAAKAQKEAEQKEKEREKKARKKEKKKAAAAAAAIEESNTAADDSSSSNTGGVSSEPKESEARENPVFVSKRSQKARQLTKQSKPKSTVPPPLRNRGRRRMQTWKWALIAVVIVLALFVLGNLNFFSFRTWFDGFGL